MVNKKGFTLVELIGVIVIMGLIALIVTPSVIGILKKQKDKLYNQQISLLEEASTKWVTENTSTIPNDGTEYKLTFNELINGGYIKSNDIIDPRDNSKIKGCMMMKWNSEKNNYISTYDSTCKNIYKEIILNGTDPVVSEGMIPVVIADDGTVTKADIYDVNTPWYNYEEKKWANIVLVSESSRSNYVSAEAGTEITSTDILAYFVWIPRYKYQLFNAAGATGTSPQEIQIQFENKETTKSLGTTNGEWLTHPAFTFGTEELNGIWVAKFETTGSASTPTVLPIATSLRNQNVSTQFATSQLFNNITTYGINNDAHMAKNSEWGAASYLTQSKYGLNNEVRINNNSNKVTGCGASAANGSEVTTCQIAYGTNISIYPQSTTGNITGIFDMSGGAWEYVMGDFIDSSGKKYSGYSSSSNSGFNGLFHKGGSLTTGIDFPDAKYYQTYTANQNILGDALLETQGWYSDYKNYVSSSYPWFVRGGNSNDSASAGVWYFLDGSGGADGSCSFRVVLRSVGR